MFFIFVIVIIPILITPAAALSIKASDVKNVYGVGEPINITVRVTPGEEYISMSITKAPSGCTHHGVMFQIDTLTDSSGILKFDEAFDTPGDYEITWSAVTKISDPYSGFYTVKRVETKTSFTVVDKIPEVKETDEKKVSLTLEHIPPTFDKDIQGGKIIVTLLNEKNEPIPNQHILIGPDMDLADVFENDYSYVYRGRITSTQKYLGITENDKAISITTDDKGNATWDYFNRRIGLGELYLDSPELGKLLFEKAKAKKPVELEGTIQAWSYELYTTGGAYSGGKILANASIPVKFTHIAEISAIGTTDSRQKAKVRVMRIDLDDYGSWFYTSWADIIRGSKQVLPKETPYKLIPGDTVLLDENDIVTVNWIGNTKMVIKTKEGFLEKVRKETGSPVNAHFTIMYGDLGKMRKFQQYMNDWKIQLGITTSGGVATSFTCSKIVCAKVAIYYGAFFGTFKLTECWDPLVIEMKSTILTDFDEDKEKATVYTVEGTGTLYNVNDGSTLDVTTGHKATVSPDGEFGSVTEFDESELNEDLRTILGYMRGEDISVSLKKGISFESRSKPSGSSVQIPLTLNGIEEKIGNMDMTLSYDPSILEATEVIKGGLTENSLFDSNIMDGTIKISLADNEGFSGDGSIAYIKFDVIGVEGSSSPLKIAAMMTNKADDYEELDILTNDGEFRVISIEEGMGDGDGDGEYTALDALYALQMAVEKIPQDPVMDINEDGSVTSLDARGILKNAVGE